MFTVADSRTLRNGKLVGWMMMSTDIVPEVSPGACTPTSMILDSFGIRRTSSKALNNATVQPLEVIRSASCSATASPLITRFPRVNEIVSGKFRIPNTDVDLACCLLGRQRHRSEQNQWSHFEMNLPQVKSPRQFSSSPEVQPSEMWVPDFKRCAIDNVRYINPNSNEVHGVRPQLCMHLCHRHRPLSIPNSMTNRFEL